MKNNILKKLISFALKRASKENLMKCILLCAGYATRLYPLTENRPKHLLDVNGKTILDYVIEKLPMEEIDYIYVVTNEKFYHNFVEWHEKSHPDLPIAVLNDHTKSNRDRLGSIGDLIFTINQKDISDNFVLISGDNLFNFSLEPMFKKLKDGKNVIALYDVKSKQEARKMGNATVDSNGIITKVVEKPKHPEDTLCSIGIYLFKKEVIKLLKQYSKEAVSLDKVGDFIAWLCQKTTLHAHVYDDPNDNWLDIGTPSQLEEAKKIYH